MEVQVQVQAEEGQAKGSPAAAGCSVLKQEGGEVPAVLIDSCPLNLITCLQHPIHSLLPKQNKKKPFNHSSWILSPPSRSILATSPRSQMPAFILGILSLAINAHFNHDTLVDNAADSGTMSSRH